MEIPCYNEIMFKYKVIDNYFDEKDLLELTLIANDPNNLQGLTDENKIEIELEEKFKDYLIKKYQNSWISYLDELYPKKKNYLIQLVFKYQLLVKIVNTPFTMTLFQKFYLVSFICYLKRTLAQLFMIMKKKTLKK